MLKFIKRYSFAAWMGIALGICEIWWYDWKFWLIMVPLVFLLAWRES